MIAASLLSLLPFLAVISQSGTPVFGAPVNGSSVSPPPPPGGADTSPLAPPPLYAPKSDFDYQSLALALHQEWIELDLFEYGLEKFSASEFEEFGLLAEHRSLIKYMSDQEIGHAQLITNMLGAGAPKRCNYTYPFETVPEFVDFCQRLTRWGEAGVYGFLPHLDSRPSAQLLLQSIVTEARQQMIFRQFEGLFPMPEYFELGIPQNWAWTLLAPYITSCPAENSHLGWQNYPALEVVNGPSGIDLGFQRLPYPAGGPSITHNRTALSYPGRKVDLKWESPGKTVGPYENGTYVTALGSNVTMANSSSPLWAMWAHQLNVTYTPILNVSGNTGYTIQPNGTTVFASTPNNPIVNGTSFIAIVDTPLFITPYNFSLINPHMVAGPAIYQAS